MIHPCVKESSFDFKKELLENLEQVEIETKGYQIS